MHKPSGSDLLFQLTVAACILSAVVTIVSFLLYVRTRLADRSADIHGSEEDHNLHLRRLDEQEERYRSIHFATLALFTLMGVLLLIQLSHHLNRPVLTE
ncbi:MAG TPA: hypothetical protein VNV35_08480 [Puia sp.]|jgi:hypothetical protein|nr:hypothetical protein [Puia sp.]